MAQLEQELSHELAGLPAQFGYNDTASFIAAVKAATDRRRGRKPASLKAPTSASGRRKRATITDETRTAVRRLAEQEKTGAEIARRLGISLPSVQNIKKGYRSRS